MKTIIIVIAGIAIILFLGFIWFVISTHTQSSPAPVSTSEFPTSNENIQAPSTSTQTPTSTTTIQEIVSQAFSNQTNITDPTLVLGRTAVVAPYALQLWNTTNGGGEALLKYDSTKGWVLVTEGGGKADVSSLIFMGVPTTTAEQLVAQL